MAVRQDRGRAAPYSRRRKAAFYYVETAIADTGRWEERDRVVDQSQQGRLTQISLHLWRPLLPRLAFSTAALPRVRRVRFHLHKFRFPPVILSVF